MTRALFLALVPDAAVNLFALCLLACSIQCGAVGTPVKVGVASVETAICVMNTYSKAKAAGRSDGDAVADCITQCGTDAATIAHVLDAHRAAELREKLGAQ